MKKNTNELLDDLLEDGAPGEFRAALLDKTLRSARRRKRVRRFNMTLSALVVAGICAFSFWKTREPGVPPTETRQVEAMAVNSQSEPLLQPGQVVTTGAGSVKEFVTSVSGYAEVETTSVSGRYEVIDDQEVLAVISGGATVPVHHGPGGRGGERNDGAGVSQIAFKQEKARLKVQPNIRHLQCAVPRPSQPSKKHKQNRGAIEPASDGKEEG